MQYLFQDQQGERSVLNAKQVEVLLASPKLITKIFHDRSSVVYALRGHEKAQPKRPLKYGGSRRERAPFTAEDVFRKGSRAYVMHNTKDDGNRSF